MDRELERAEAERLEQLWAGGFGDAYVERNKGAGSLRARFWAALLARYDVRNVLEIGCNVGGNLRWIAPLLEAGSTAGVDVNERAVEMLRAQLPTVQVTIAPARELPFPDRSFDLAFTSGVLIHQPDDSLPQVMDEMVRVSRQYVLAMEYQAPEPIEVPYHGERGALFKRDYVGLFITRFPQLALLERGFLGPDAGWDDVTWSIFERRDATETERQIP